MNDNGLPVLTKPVNRMELGLNADSFQMQALPKHPVDELQRRQALDQISFTGTTKEEEACRLHGSGFAMMLAAERRMAEPFQALPGTGRARRNITADILSGNDTKLSFDDVLNLPHHRPEFAIQENDLHRNMERQLGMM
eukprot:Nitzschia sp. Nitz4//scaffold41_size133979//108320//108844//NITZ4_003366-RA/size133979-snap-gene-0.108-mRNA-1//1//CDS//3329551527//6724//frame0